MNALAGFLKEWFGYTRRERRSACFLLLVIVIIVITRIVVPEKTVPVGMIPLNMDDYSGGRTEEKTQLPDSGAKLKSGGTGTKDNFKRIVIDINNCDSARLTTLPGIGPVLSARIIRYRDLLGGYAAVEQLREVYGLPAETFNLISLMVTADPSDVLRIKINKAEFRELLRHPYIEKEEVQAIMKYRELQGIIRNREDLVNNKLISRERVEKILPYIDFATD